MAEFFEKSATRKARPSLKVPRVCELRDDRPVPWSRDDSVSTLSQLVVDQEKMIVKTVEIVEPEINRNKPRHAVVLHGSTRQPTVVEGIIDLAVDQVRRKSAGG